MDQFSLTDLLDVVTKFLGSGVPGWTILALMIVVIVAIVVNAIFVPLGWTRQRSCPHCGKRLKDKVDS